MIYNFFLGHTASTLSKLIGRSVSDFEPQTYPLHEVEGQSDAVSYVKTDSDGKFCRLGFYLRYYKNKYLILGKTPSLHIDFCDNIAELKHIMRATNSPVVTYYSKENGKAYPNQKLKVCQKCLSLLKEKTSMSITGKTFEDFILSVEENDETKCKVADMDGYALNWQQISRAYRETKNYTCEKCAFKLPNLSYLRFMQTHHIDSFAKLNNKRSNLKCLCVKCHSEVDDYHTQQFTTTENQLLLAEFEECKRQL